MATVGIVGAGVSGLACAKSAIECGLRPTIFEKSSRIGGTWRPSDGLVWDGMRANLSQRSMSYSDFPWPFDTQKPNPTAHETYRYLTEYATRFDLLDCVRPDSAVKSVSRSGGKWQICYGDDSDVAEFDFVLVASGVFSAPWYPDIPGLLDVETDKPHPWFTHSAAFETADNFRDQTVIVLGNVYSGADITVALARGGAKRVVSVANRPLWFTHRLIPNENGKLLPVDAYFKRPTEKVSIEEKLRRQHKLYNHWNGGDPGRFAKDLTVGDTSLTAPYLSITDRYLEDVSAGRVELKQGVSSFDGKVATFKDGSNMEFDHVICATGYRMVLPFLDESTKKTLDFLPHNSLQPVLMHKTTFHPDLPNLAFVGMFRGPYFAMIELQARWACMAFSGECPYPTAEEMAAGIQEEKELRGFVPRPQFHHVGYALAEDISKIMGVFPQEELDGKSGAMLAKRLREGPLLPAHYRLCGPHANREVALATIRKFNEDIEE
ncbi:hypothetical protein BSKO_11963 [Bryopsis sp. KO-2023]|nr:hypothetical protein BSKO_11963 [Bryopsis sp. KO-2023]